MEAQLERHPHGHHHHEADPHGHHHHEADPHSTGLHSGEQHHGEKKSVLKKVKDKAKKIKDTIKKHGHGHDHDGGHRQGFEEDDEVINDPEVHGAPIYESNAIRSSNIYIPRENISNLEKPTDRREDRYNHNVRNEGTTQPLVSEHRPMEAPAPAPHHTTTLPNVEHPNIKVNHRVGLEEDPHAPTNTPPNVLPSNYQSKVSDPTAAGGKEADGAPLVRQLDNLNVGDHDAPGRHVQFAPKPTPMQKQFNPESKTENMELNLKGQFNLESKTENTDLNLKGQDSGDTGGMPMNTIAGKVSSATSAVASKLGYGGDHQEDGQDTSSYTRKVTETLAPVYDKVAETGSAVISKVSGMVGGESEGGDHGPSMKEYLSEKFRPGDEDRALSEVITNALHKKEEEKGEKKLGKVTMSKEVEARLGGDEDSKREGEDAIAAGRESSGQGVMERLTDAVGSWLGKSEGIQTAKDSIGQSHVSDATSGSGGVGEGKE